MRRSRQRKRELRAKRNELRAELKRRRAAVVARRPPKKRSRRRWILLLILLILLLLLLRDCRCNEVVEEPPVVAGDATLVVPAPLEVVPEAVVPRPVGRVARVDRPEFRSEVPGPIPWVASFRLQVAARSPRLAECFVGAHRPGTLKWTAAVEPGAGRVSDMTLEPTLLSDELTRPQRVCVLGVLSDPPYELPDGGERSTPSRVGMVIEF